MRRFPTLTKLENDLLTDAQKRQLVAHDNAARDSYDRWRERIDRRLFDDEDVPDTVDSMMQPVGVRLMDAYFWPGEDDYSEESYP